MIDRETMMKWIGWARRDDWHTLFVGSDIRVMLGEIDRLHAALKAILRTGNVKDGHNTANGHALCKQIAAEALGQSGSERHE